MSGFEAAKFAAYFHGLAELQQKINRVRMIATDIIEQIPIHYPTRHRNKPHLFKRIQHLDSRTIISHNYFIDLVEPKELIVNIGLCLLNDKSKFFFSCTRPIIQ